MDHILDEQVRVTILMDGVDIRMEECGEWKFDGAGTVRTTPAHRLYINDSFFGEIVSEEKEGPNKILHFRSGEYKGIMKVQKCIPGTK